MEFERCDHPAGRETMALSPTIRGFLLELGEGMRELFWPTQCVVCNLPGTLLCSDCESILPRIDPASACPRCGAPFGVLTCTECDPDPSSDPFPFESARCYGEYRDGIVSLVRAYKDEGERRCAPLIAALIVKASPGDWHGWARVITYVPATPAAMRRRGFDHMSLVADELGDLLEIPVCRALSRSNAADQRRLGRRQRAHNASGSFRMSCAPEILRSVQGKNVLLVDDVVTTGATCCAAASTLLEARVAAVRVLALARVW
jgi:ComF family protein